MDEQKNVGRGEPYMGCVAWMYLIIDEWRQFI